MNQPWNQCHNNNYNIYGSWIKRKISKKSTSPQNNINSGNNQSIDPIVAANQSNNSYFANIILPMNNNLSNTNNTNSFNNFNIPYSKPNVAMNYPINNVLNQQNSMFSNPYSVSIPNNR